MRGGGGGRTGGVEANVSQSSRELCSLERAKTSASSLIVCAEQYRPSETVTHASPRDKTKDHTRLAQRAHAYRAGGGDDGWRGRPRNPSMLHRQNEPSWLPDSVCARVCVCYIRKQVVHLKFFS